MFGNFGRMIDSFDKKRGRHTSHNNERTELSLRLRDLGKMFCVCSLLNKPTVPENGTHHTVEKSAAKKVDARKTVTTSLPVVTPSAPVVTMLKPASRRIGDG